MYRASIRKVYGPYDHKQQVGRQYVNVYYLDGTRRTLLYSRHVYEMAHDQRLPDTVDVDHINGDRSDDRLENLQLLPRSENAAKHAKMFRPTPMLEVVCECGARFEVQERVHRRNQIVLKKAGPYCSKSCAGRFSHPKVAVAA